MYFADGGRLGFFGKNLSFFFNDFIRDSKYSFKKRVNPPGHQMIIANFLALSLYEKMDRLPPLLLQRVVFPI